MLQRIERALSAPVAFGSMAVVLFLFGRAAWGRRWMSDDGYIYLRVVRQVIHGNGPVFNSGDRVEATTSPLWLYMLTLGKEIIRPVSLPWLAVVLGLILAIAGLALAQWGAYRLWTRGRPRIVVPLGAIVIAATPAFWEYATSGLETGLEFAWLGACFWGLTELVRRREAPEAGSDVEDRAKALSLHGDNEHRTSNREILKSAWLPVLIGLGPLVRPDFMLFTIAFLAAMFIVRRPAARREWLLPLVLAFALPLMYEVFRAGYYAELSPNPAFAKEASKSRWDQGWFYLWDTARTYWILIPIALVFVAALPSLFSSRRDRAVLAVIAAPIAAGLAHGLYTIYVGGDFMHARMLLPAVFAIVMPFSVIAIANVLVLAPLAGIAAWAVVCSSSLHPSYDSIGPRGIANERSYYLRSAGKPHPITGKDYEAYWGRAMAVLENAQLPPRSLLLKVEDPPIPMRADVKHDRVIVANNIGIVGWVMDDDVYLLDDHGLANTLASRLILAGRGRPGHEKGLQGWWIVALYTDPSYTTPGNEPPNGDIEQARIALQCGDLPELLAAVTDPMTPGRFAHNIVDAFRLHRFRFSGNPYNAVHDLCGDQPPPA